MVKQKTFQNEEKLFPIGLAVRLTSNKAIQIKERPPVWTAFRSKMGGAFKQSRVKVRSHLQHKR